MQNKFTREQLEKFIEMSKKQVEEVRYFKRLSEEGMDD